jgi:hypothetical protein
LKSVRWLTQAPENFGSRGFAVSCTCAGICASRSLRPTLCFENRSYRIQNEPFDSRQNTPEILCLSLFPWATFRKTKAAVKVHTLLDLRGNIPCRVHVTPASVHDVNVLDLLPIEAGSFYIRF